MPPFRQTAFEELNRFAAVPNSIFPAVITISEFADVAINELPVPTELPELLNVLAPVTVKVPEPVFINLARFEPSEYMPEKVVFELSPPHVIETAEAPEAIIEPLPAKEPTVSVFPFKSNVPFTINALASDMAVPGLLLSTNVAPLFMVVLPP
jgi:hypothetical protein